MQDEIVRIQDMEILQEEAPFLFYLPEGLEIENATYRNQGRKWATLRFECTIGEEKLRVKEFFLDWFYPGFPKSLMDSFVSSYSAIESADMGDRVIFYGKNYKGKNASSSFSLGTQLEAEGETTSNVRKLSERMTAPYPKSRFRRYPFYVRSFFANDGKPEWFEEERISNLSWRAPSRELCIGNLCADSVGNLSANGKTLETVLVFSEDYYRRVAWVDIAQSNPRNEHLVYELRDGGNFFDVLEEDGCKLAFRRDNGPAIAQFNEGSHVTTISVSPLFHLSDTRDLIGSLREEVGKLENFI